MIPFLQKHIRGICLALFVLLGVALGDLAATGLGFYLRPSAAAPKVPAETQETSAQKQSLADFQAILQRNIFDSSAPGSGSLTAPEKGPQTDPPPAAPRTDLKLLGTVAAGKESLALIVAGREIALYRLNEEVPGGGLVEAIERNVVKLRHRDGSLGVLPLYDGEAIPAALPSGGGSGAVTEVGENRWVIDSEAAEAARGNLGELLKSARMEPNLVEGRTEGFEVKMIRPRSLLAELGIRKGDVIMEVNGMELDSPEKGLQIFQQLREARHISIGLQRAGAPLNFNYEVN